MPWAIGKQGVEFDHYDMCQHYTPVRYISVRLTLIRDQMLISASLVCSGLLPAEFNAPYLSKLSVDSAGVVQNQTNSRGEYLPEYFQFDM